MKRSTFMAIAAVVGLLFSVALIAAPSEMMVNLGTESNAVVNVVLQAVSVFLFAIALITFMARKDPGSIALRALLLGSAVLHTIAFPVDWIALQQDTFTNAPGILPGTIVHALLAVGFFYYLMKLPRITA